MLVALALLAAEPAEVRAQEEACAVEARAGAAVPTGGQDARLQSGLALAVGADCPVGDGLRVGGGLAHHRLDRYGFSLLQGTADLELARFGEVGSVLELRGLAAVAFGTQLGVRLVDSGFGDFSELDDSGRGPALGTSIRLRAPLGGAAWLLVDAGWRVAWTDRVRLRDLEPVDRRSETIHWFPVSAGFRFGL